VSRLMETGVDFEAVDFPQANRFTVHILAAVAEYEARLISERTKAGLAAAKARGVKLGSRTPTSGNPAGLAKARQVTLEKSAARTADLAPVIAEIRVAGFLSAIAVARQLSARGIRPVHADRWSPSSVRYLLSRLSLRRSVSESRQALHAAKQRWIASLAPVLADVRRSGHRKLTSIGRELNARGVSTFRGGRWDGTAVQKALKCLPEDQSQSIYLTHKEFASRLRPVIEEIQAAGKTGAYSIASALNARGIPGLNGGRWRRIQVHRLLKRLSMVAKRRNTMAEWLPSLAGTITEVRAAGHLSTTAMAEELNTRGVRACRAGRWTMRRVCETLREMRRNKIDYEPWLPSVARFITEVRAAGHLSTAAMASELNARGVCARRGGRWTMRKVHDALREMQRHKIDYEPKEDVALTASLDAPKAKNPKRSKGMHSAKSTAFRPVRRPSKSKRLSRGLRKSARALVCAPPVRD
jgi:Resolvase, N terminal domain